MSAASMLLSVTGVVIVFLVSLNWVLSQSNKEDGE